MEVSLSITKLTIGAFYFIKLNLRVEASTQIDRLVTMLLCKGFNVNVVLVLEIFHDKKPSQYILDMH